MKILTTTVTDVIFTYTEKMTASIKKNTNSICDIEEKLPNLLSSFLEEITNLTSSNTSCFETIKRLCREGGPHFVLESAIIDQIEEIQTNNFEEFKDDRYVVLIWNVEEKEYIGALAPEQIWI